MSPRAEDYLSLVRRIAEGVVRSMPSWRYEIEDVVSYGYIGLLDALSNYNPRCGEFEPYAQYRIKGAIIDGLRSESDHPRRLYEIRKQMIAAEDSLTANLGRHPTTAEIADYTQNDEESLRGVERAIYRLENDGNVCEQEIIEAQTSGSREDEKTDTRCDVQAAMLQLPERERCVVFCLYWCDMTQAEVAELLGCHSTRISQLNKQALELMEGLLEPHRGD